MVKIQEGGVYPFGGSKFGGIALVTLIDNGEVFGRVLVCWKDTKDFSEYEFHRPFSTVENHQFFQLYIGRKPGEAELATVKACECVTNINVTFN